GHLCRVRGGAGGASAEQGGRAAGVPGAAAAPRRHPYRSRRFHPGQPGDLLLVRRRSRARLRAPRRGRAGRDPARAAGADPTTDPVLRLGLRRRHRGPGGGRPGRPHLPAGRDGRRHADAHLDRRLRGRFGRLRADRGHHHDHQPGPRAAGPRGRGGHRRRRL
ncbi:MAG: hypothetical protein AVDCRST_MAG41-1733, partial [uncultured Corynebacteriales bacterium]